MSFRIGIDIGGTFTDAVSVDEEGSLVAVKSPTTPGDLKVGVLKCIDEIARKLNVDRKKYLGNVAAIVNGTTHGTDIVVTQSGARVGIIATKGHTDVLELRRVRERSVKRPYPEPLVPRHLRTGVEERIIYTGEVLKPLNEEDVHKAVAYFKKMGVKSIVVSLIFSFLNPEHEKRIGEIIRQDYPEAQVILSHEILSAPGEYERTSTAAIEAYIRPAIAEYIKSLRENLTKEGFKGQLLFIQNNGGIETPEVALQKPRTLPLSGPAAGPVAAILAGGLNDYKRLLSVDMGGTSCNIAIVDDGKVMFRNESMVGDHRLNLPVADVETLGAGGGSIVWFDLGGILNVGPASAGAVPGPACYGTGGAEATFTDAAVVLGYISPDDFLGGQLKLRRDLAEKAIKEKVAGRLRTGIPQAAAAAYKVYNSVMANGISHAFIKYGYDPRDFVLCAGGAASPLSALKIATELGMKGVLITKVAPVYSSFGMLSTDLRHDFWRYYHAATADLDLSRVKKLYAEMEAEGTRLLENEGVPDNRRVLLRTMRVRYYAQYYDIEVPWPGGPITKQAINEGTANFHRRHKEIYGRYDENYPLEITGFGLTATGKIPRVSPKKIKAGGNNAASAWKGERDAYFEESAGFVKTRIYDGDKLLAGNILPGPCIVEEKLATVVIPPGFKMRVDEYGNYVT